MSNKGKGTMKTDKLRGLAERRNESLEPAAQVVAFDSDEVAPLAYKLWQERGCPLGSDQEDWFRAENELKNRTVLVAMAGGIPRT
jgi:hypothetical protein